MTQVKRTQDSDPAAHARRLVEESGPIYGTLGERYLRESRGITGPLPRELRFNPAVWTKETRSTHPALIVPAFEDGDVRRLQAILLNPETAAKASLTSAKLTFGRDAAHVPGDFAARSEGGPVLLAEGPEDAITVWSVTGHRTLVAFSASSLDSIDLPDGTDLVICSDADETGRKASLKAAKVHKQAGCRVRIARPVLP